ncbi:MiaB/RimO family radical SAM methylthiotransferase, partial [Thermodesulfobacteriota bacterium]
NPQIISKDFGQDPDFEFLPIDSFLGRTRAFLKVQDGCESFCSYCIVPYARGPQRSLDQDKVIRMLERLSAAGYKEIVLTGIHLGKYGIESDGDEGLKGLLRRIGKQGLPVRIRLSSLEPTEIDQELIEMVVSEEWLCSHFHVPLQSGDNGILKKMNRTYTSEEFVGIIELIHRMLPLAAIGVDVMAGFPGEDKNAHRNSYSLIKALPISYLHVFPFSPRKGTPAGDFPGQVGQSVIKERAGELRELGKEKRSVFHKLCLGREFPVLTEGWVSNNEKMIKGLSDNYLRVTFPSSRLVRNRLVIVRIEEVGGDRVMGKPA